MDANLCDRIEVELYVLYYTLFEQFYRIILMQTKYWKVFRGHGWYHWVDNHIVRATRFDGKFTDLVKKDASIEVFKS